MCDCKDDESKFPGLSLDPANLLDLIAAYEGQKLAYAISGAKLTSKKPRCSVDVLLPQIEPGITRFQDAYGGDLASQVAAYVSITDSAAYVIESDLKHASELLRSAGTIKNKLLLRVGRELREFAVRPLSDVTTQHLLQLGDKVVLKEWRCAAFDPGQCINIFDVKTKQFVYSVKLDQSIGLCRPDPNSSCEHRVNQITWNIYKAADCVGPAISATRWITECDI